jgi:hypothetical protein
MSDDDLNAYRRIKDRINQLEKKIEHLEDLPYSRLTNQKIESYTLTLKANTELLWFLFGEACLRQ